MMKKLRKALKRCRDEARYTVSGRERRKALTYVDFSLIASDCTGGVLYHDLKLPFLSPTVNFYFDANDYIKFIRNMREYLDKRMVPLETESETRGYPVALLGDIKLYLVHYSSIKEAQAAWDRRKERIRWDKLFFIMTDRNDCSEEALLAFDGFVTENHYPAVVFTHVPRPDLKNSFYLPGAEQEQYVPIMTQFVKPLQRRMDQFDWVGWINGG